ncbi:MAG: hypothetical protein AVO34_13360 [Firmicutes bacterium ML8_F2]|jgi:integral membrane sensor domain MASE1|nr:MAG: hypothetical protein AVO34_13360 [Firmicutes bacterium ML8_F2]
MARKITAGIIGGLLGFIAGLLGGAFIGLVIGGTFFGWLEIPGYPQMPAYELAAYIGAVLGILIVTPLGIKLALKIAGQKEKQD